VETGTQSNGTKLRIDSPLANGLRKGKLRHLERDDGWIAQYDSVSSGLLRSLVVPMPVFMIGPTAEIDRKLELPVNLRLA
jgi:hypothetical protein